MEVYGDNCSTR